MIASQKSLLLISLFGFSQMLKLVSTVPLLVKPNSRVSYSNLGFNLLGHGLGEYTNWSEKQTNKTWESLLKRLIIDNIGLQNTGVFHDMSDAQGNFAFGYEEGQQVKLYDLAWNNPAGGMFSSTEGAI
jgi:CubicO group peptidase (beta-lactamase class C family)